MWQEVMRLCDRINVPLTLCETVSYPSCQPQGYVTLLSSVGDLEFIVMEACIERPPGLS